MNDTGAERTADAVVQLAEPVRVHAVPRGRVVPAQQERELQRCRIVREPFCC